MTTPHPPPDPMTFLTEAAAQQHELFMAWVNSGFTRAEALQLLIKVMQNSMNNVAVPDE